MARRKNSKLGCLLPILIFLVIPLIVYLVQKPKGPEVPFDQSVPDNHLVYFDVVAISLTDSSTQRVTSTTRRTVRTGVQQTRIYRCTTSSGDVVNLYIQNSSLNSWDKKSFNPDNAVGSRIHGVKVGDGSNAYVRFESMTPLGS